jgi:hypothetical protein
MAAGKLLNTWAVLAKIESAYGTDITPAANADGVLVIERPEVEKSFMHNGERGAQAGTGGMASGVAASGPKGETSLMCECHGGGAAYSASVFPSIHTLLLMAGFEATVDTTPSSETWTYVPESGPTDFDSGSVYCYVRGQLEKLLGAYCDMSVSVDGPAVPIWEFAVQGIRDVETDVAVPAVSGGYPAGTNLPPKATNIALTLNSVSSFKVRGFTLNLNRELGDRADDNDAGYAGLSPGRRSPTLEVVVESTALATFNPYSLWLAGTLFSTSLTVGSVQYKKWTITAAQSRIIDVSEDDDGPTATWTITLELSTSDAVTEDDISILFD